MAKFSDGVHFLVSFKRLCVINDKQDASVAFVKKVPQHVQCNSLHHLRFTPAASPQELSVIRSMGRISQGFSEAFYGAPIWLYFLIQVNLISYILRINLM